MAVCSSPSTEAKFKGLHQQPALDYYKQYCESPPIVFQMCVLDFLDSYKTMTAKLPEMHSKLSVS